jgi:protein-tyrosine-phosphatase
MTADQTPVVAVHFDAEIADISARLGHEFAGLAPEFITDIVRSSYSELASRATVPTFVPALTERFARERLKAVARLEGETKTVPTVLFLCIHNAGRSQMALGFFEHHAAGRAVAWSGGSEPADKVNPSAVAAMAERGIDISRAYPKPWTTEILKAADVVVTMGCGDTCPYYPGTRYEDWELEDPAGKDVAAVRPVRDDIERRVLELLDSLGVSTR